jgi:hypothetical protein
VAAVSPAAAVARWWFPAIPRSRLAWLRVFAYLFILLDVFQLTAWVRLHGHLDGDLYQPLFIGRALPLPVPTEAVVAGVRWGLVAAVVVALSGRLPRVAGTAVAVLYLQWMVIAFSYGKVDHDRFGFVVALFVLASVGRAGFRDHTPDERVGWAIRSIQVAAVATYFLSAFAKVRFGGWGWVNSATLLRATIRRGTWITEPLVENPELLHAFQYVLITAELLSPLLLVRGRIGRTCLYAALTFHAVTLATLKIAFFPHLVTLLAFVALERLSGGAPADAAAGADPVSGRARGPGAGTALRRRWLRPPATAPTPPG